MNGALPVVLLVLLTGCSTASFDGFPDRALDTSSELRQLKTRIELDRATYDGNETDAVNKRRARNEIVNARIALIDINFTEYLKNLHQVGVGLNLGTSAATIGLGAAGALVSGGTSQILSGTSAAVTGFKESVDKEAFFEQTMPALVTKMIAERQRALVTLREGLTKPVDQYPLAQALGELETYYYAGTISGALAGVAQDAGADLASANADLAKITSAYRPDQATACLKALDDEAAIRAWMNRNGLADEPWVDFFLSSANYEEQRAAAAAELCS